MRPLAVVGRTTRDVVDSRPPRAGGAPLYAARALAALGERALLVTRCAQEDEPLLAPLRALGLPVVWRAEARSAAFRLEYGDDGGRAVSIEALGEAWSPGDARGWLAEALGDAGWVHAGALWRGEFPAETLAELARGRRLSLDGQGLVRPGRIGPVEPDAGFDPAMLAHVDVLHLSEPEAGTLGLSLDARSLGSLGVPEIVVTLGGRGCVVFAGGAAEAVPARPLRGVDPTGAGDAFTVAYVACRRRGRRPLRAARRATEVVHALLAEGLRA